MKPHVSRPTEKELARGPTVTLVSHRITRSAWVPHGFAYPIRFDGQGKAVVLESHFDLWIGGPLAAKMGMKVTRTPEAKPEPKPKAKKQSPKEKK